MDDSNVIAHYDFDWDYNFHHKRVLYNTEPHVAVFISRLCLNAMHTVGTWKTGREEWDDVHYIIIISPRDSPYEFCQKGTAHRTHIAAVGKIKYCAAQMKSFVGVCGVFGKSDFLLQ